MQTFLYDVQIAALSVVIHLVVIRYFSKTYFYINKSPSKIPAVFKFSYSSDRTIQLSAYKLSDNNKIIFPYHF